MVEITAIVSKLIAVVVTLMTMVGALQADVNTLKSRPTVFGAVPVLSSPLEVEGSQTFLQRKGFSQGSSTLVSFLSPGATSTFTGACNVRTNVLANNFELGWGANAFSTTTVLARMQVAANDTEIVRATTTNLTATILGGVDGAIPPNSWVNFRFGTSSLVTPTVSPAGFCTAEFRVI